MPVIDSQVHAYERDHAGRPWMIKIEGGADQATGADHVAVMDGADVDGALIVSPFILYGTDTSYARQVRDAYPRRFAMIAPVNPAVPGVGDRIADWASVPGAVGIRLMVGFDAAFQVTDDFRADDPGVREAVRAAARHNLPICIFCWGKLSIVSELAQLYPDAHFIIDHLGIAQPFFPPAPDDPFSVLDEVLALAAFPNVSIKVSGACTLSHRPFPFPDLWAPLARIYDAFGIDRCMWGTDWTRAVHIVPYQEAVQSFREMPGLSRSDRDALMGGSVIRIFGWSPS